MRDMDRRQALLTFGGVSLTALLAACGDSGSAGSSSTTTVETGNGTTTTVETQGTTSSTEALFDDVSACVLTAEETEGPYYFDVDSIRSDIREDRGGATLRLAAARRGSERRRLPLSNLRKSSSRPSPMRASRLRSTP